MKPNTASPWLILIIALTAICLMQQPSVSRDKAPTMPCATFTVVNTLSKNVEVNIHGVAFTATHRTNNYFRIFGECKLLSVTSYSGKFITEIEGQINRIQLNKIPMAQ